jgi:Thrombospondin type 1 domain
MYASRNRYYEPPVIRYEIDENIRIWHQGGGNQEEEGPVAAAGGGGSCTPYTTTPSPTENSITKQSRLLNEFIQTYGQNTNILDLIQQHGLDIVNSSLEELVQKGLVLPNVTRIQPKTKEEYDTIMADINRGIFPTPGMGGVGTTTPFVGGGGGPNQTTSPSIGGGPTQTTTPSMGGGGGETTSMGEHNKDTSNTASNRENKVPNEKVSTSQHVQTTKPDQKKNDVPTTLVIPVSSKSNITPTIPSKSVVGETPTMKSMVEETQQNPTSVLPKKNPYAYIPDASLAAIPAIQQLPYIQYNGLSNFSPQQSLPYVPPIGIQNFSPQQPVPYVPDLVNMPHVPPAQPPQPVNCQYSWGPWSSCDQDTGTMHRQAATMDPVFGGTGCDPLFAMDTSTCPVDCIGSYVADYCTNGDYYRTYNVTKSSMNEGNTCSLNDGTYGVKFQAPAPNQYSIRVDSCSDCTYKIAPIGCDQSTGFQKYTVTSYTPAVNKGRPCTYADGTAISGIGQTFTSTADMDACQVDCCGNYTNVDYCSNGNYIREYNVTKPSIHKDGRCTVRDSDYAVEFAAPSKQKYNVRVDGCSDCTYNVTYTGCDSATGFNKYSVNSYNPAVRKGKECSYVDGTKITNVGQAFTSTASTDSCVIPCAGQYVAGTERCDSAGNLYRTYQVTTSPIHATTCSINDGTYSVNFPISSVDANKKIEMKVGTCAVACSYTGATNTCNASGQQVISLTGYKPAINSGKCTYNGEDVTSYVNAQGTFTSQKATCTNCVGSWGACSAACGDGTQTYTITTNASGGGTACEAANNATKPCKIKPCDVDCVGSWSACPAVHNGGSQTYTITQNAVGNGKACEAANNQTRSCPIDCIFSESVVDDCANSGFRIHTITGVNDAQYGGNACIATDYNLNKIPISNSGNGVGYKYYTDCGKGNTNTTAAFESLKCPNNGWINKIESQNWFCGPAVRYRFTCNDGSSKEFDKFNPNAINISDDYAGKCNSSGGDSMGPPIIAPNGLSSLDYIYGNYYGWDNGINKIVGNGVSLGGHYGADGPTYNITCPAGQVINTVYGHGHESMGFLCGNGPQQCTENDYNYSDGACSATCGGGTFTRTWFKKPGATCINGSFGGANSATESLDCNTQACPPAPAPFCYKLFGFINVCV